MHYMQLAESYVRAADRLVGSDLAIFLEPTGSPEDR